jgi:hypothetical protein
MTAKKILLNWLSGNDIKKVLQGFDFLANKYGDEQLRNDTALQSARLKALEEQRAKNSISPVDDRIEAARIMHNLWQMSLALSNKWSFEELEIAPVTIPAASKGRWKKITLAIVAIIGVLGGIAEFSGYSIRDLFKNNSTVEKPVETRPSASNASTTGDKSPAIITRDGDVSINYGDTTAKKDSTSK